MQDIDLCILKVLLSNKKHAVDFANDYDAKLFSNQYWNFANVILQYIKIYKEPPTLRILEEKFSSSKEKLDLIRSIFTKVNELSYDEKEFKYDLDKIKKRFAMKEIISVKDKFSSFEENADVSGALSSFQKTIQSVKALNQVKAYERKTLKESIPLFKEEYNAKIKNPNFDSGVKTGYNFVDSATDGLRDGELLLIGGESGAGKSLLLMNMAVQMWMQNNTLDSVNFTEGNHVLYFSLEMPFVPCRNRLLSRISDIPSKKIRKAKLNGEEILKLKKGTSFIERYPYEFEIIDIPRGVTIESIESIYEDICSRYIPKIVVIDYLGLMDYQGDANLDDWLKLGKIAEKIHEFARVHKVIVLSAVQLNRIKPGKDEAEAVGLHRIGRSALIMQNANIALQILSHKNESLLPFMDVFLIKNRDGELTHGKLVKNLANSSLLDVNENEDCQDFLSYDDISEEVELLE